MKPVTSLVLERRGKRHETMQVHIRDLSKQVKRGTTQIKIHDCMEPTHWEPSKIISLLPLTPWGLHSRLRRPHPPGSSVFNLCAFLLACLVVILVRIYGLAGKAEQQLLAVKGRW